MTLNIITIIFLLGVITQSLVILYLLANSALRRKLVGETPIYDQLVREHNHRGWRLVGRITNGY
jgi:hypothetical protein